LYALGHACTHRRFSDVRRYQHSVEGVSDHLSYNAYYAANPGQTNQHTQGIVRAESGYYCRDPLRFSLWDSIGSTLIQQFRLPLEWICSLQSAGLGSISTLATLPNFSWCAYTTHFDSATCLRDMCVESYDFTHPSNEPESTLHRDQNNYRSHFGSRYTSGRCAQRSPFLDMRGFSPRARRQKTKASSTRRASQAVPHPSTSRAFHRLASGFR
jgi:hypothetical protein